MSACPSDETVALFFEGKLPDEPAAELRRHVDGCSACREVLADAVRDPVPSGDRSGSVEIGDVLGGKYRIEAPIGSGGMGAVYRGRHVELDRPVAIKVLHTELVVEQSVLRRISREARATAALTSPHVVRILDIERMPNGIPYIVMELLDGRDLASTVEASGPLGFDTVIDIGLQVTAALSEAHGHGIVHRDLKPSNLFATASGLIKLVDFGLAKRLPFGNEDSPDSGDTRTRAFLGSPHYMAPEQIRSAKSVDARADLWSLGATLYFLLTGQVPFTAPTLYLLCSKILSVPPVPISVHRPEVPEALAAVVLRCLEKNPNARYASADELAAALRAAHESLDETAQLAPMRKPAATDPILTTQRIASAEPAGMTIPSGLATAGSSRPGVTSEQTIPEELATHVSTPRVPRHESLVVAFRRDVPLRMPSQHLLRDVARITVGRADGDLVTNRFDASIELKLDDGHLSSRHFVFERVADGWILRDLGSTNGTFLNGQPHREGPVQDRDIVEAGRTLFVFRSYDGSPALDPVTSFGEEELLRSLAPAAQSAFRALGQLAPARLPLLLQGEGGVGKEILARTIHRLSGRSGAFVAVDCAAIPAGLHDNELFGHRRGAFVGATDDHVGLLRSAHGGTLFLDEISALPVSTQSTLVRALQERQIRPLGASQPVPVDFRLVAATRQPLRAAIEAGQFRQDLHARISGSTVRVPSLHDRIEDLGIVIRAVLIRGGANAAITLTAAASRALFAYVWPRNVREVEATIESAVVLAQGGPIDLPHLPEAVRAANVV